MSETQTHQPPEAIQTNERKNHKKLRLRHAALLAATALITGHAEADASAVPQGTEISAPVSVDDVSKATVAERNSAANRLIESAEDTLNTAAESANDLLDTGVEFAEDNKPVVAVGVNGEAQSLSQPDHLVARKEVRANGDVEISETAANSFREGQPETAIGTSASIEAPGEDVVESSDSSTARGSSTAILNNPEHPPISSPEKPKN